MEDDMPSRKTQDQDARDIEIRYETVPLFVLRRQSACCTWTRKCRLTRT